MKIKTDTIVAQATASGRGGVGILRVSGDAVKDVAIAILNKIPKPRFAEYLPFYEQNGDILDQGIALFFPNPHSFTGEDVLELHGHGGPVIVDMLLKCILRVDNVRIARPGEFSERAFLNDKIDLAQAEAMADLIEASSEQAAKSAMLSLQGAFSRKINRLVDQLIHLRLFVEAAMDFPDEEIDFLSDGKIEDKLDEVIAQLNSVCQEAKQGSLLKEGMRIVIAGRPNAGKSSLLNLLAGHDAAIVTEIAGTTRDVLREQIHLDGMPLHVIDTAGLRYARNAVERMGIERAWQEIAKADRVLLVVDSTTVPVCSPKKWWPALIKRLPAHVPVTVIRNKVDLTGESLDENQIDGYPLIKLSARTGQGAAVLRAHLKSSMGWVNHTEGGFLARRRHLNALARAERHLLQAREQLVVFHASELFAEELRLGQVALSEITGAFTSDDLLGKIFGSFCIGK